MVIFDILELKNNILTVEFHRSEGDDFFPQEMHISKNYYDNPEEVIFDEDFNEYYYQSIDLEDTYHWTFEINEDTAGPVYVYIKSFDRRSNDTISNWQTAAVYDISPIYKQALGYIKKFPHKDNKKFINFILMYNAFKIFINTGNRENANALFNKLIKKDIKSPNCECYGELSL